MLPGPSRLASVRAAGDEPAVRLGPLGRPIPGRVPPRACRRAGRPLTATAMDFVLALHSHLPYVLHHGRWPHGSDWLCEAAVDTYLPLLEKLQELAAQGTPAPATIGFTPVLANQLASPDFVKELEAFSTSGRRCARRRRPTSPRRGTRGSRPSCSSGSRARARYG